jgi:hypothetical protein
MKHLPNQEDEQNQELSQQEILWKILASVERIDTTLIGNAYTNNKGLVHKVDAHEEKIESLDRRINKIELSNQTEEKLEKKNHSVWGIAASWAAAIIAIIALIFSKK